MPLYTFSILSHYELVSGVSETVFNRCREAGVNEENCNKIDLALVEALNNSIRHSYYGRRDEKVDIELEIIPGKVKLVIIDYGMCRTNLEKATLDFDPEDIENLPENGMGLFIIENLMDETNYITDSKKNVYTIIKYF